MESAIKVFDLPLLNNNSVIERNLGNFEKKELF